MTNAGFNQPGDGGRCPHGVPVGAYCPDCGTGSDLTVWGCIKGSILLVLFFFALGFLGLLIKACVG